MTNLTLKCVCINNKKRKLLYLFYHGLSCDLEPKKKNKTKKKDNYNNINIINEIKSYNKSAEFNKI